MKTQHILIGVAGLGVIYYLYQKSNKTEKEDIKSNISINQDEIPQYSNNDLMKIRYNIDGFIRSWCKEFQIEENDQFIVNKVMELTNVKPTSTVELKKK